MRPLSECVFYQIQPRAFTPEGTLDAAGALLPHIASLGVDVVFLCPVVTADRDEDRAHWSQRALSSGFDNPCNPYRTMDYEHVDSEYGTDESLRAFVRAAHRVGLRVLLDAVYYHCGPHCRLAKEHPEWFLRRADGSIDPGDFNMLRFDFAQQGIREYFTQNMLRFVRAFDVDGFRCDCGDWVPAEFWEDAVERLKAEKPSLIMLNEGHHESHLRQAFQIEYGFTWGDKLTKLVDEHEGGTREIMQGMEEVTRRARPGRYGLRGLENHDFANDAMERRMDHVLPACAVEAAMVANFGLDGIPYLYNGNELADGRRHSIFSNRFYGKREYIDWSLALTQRGRARLALVSELCALRHREPVLSGGSTAYDMDAPEGVIAYERALLDARVLVCASLSTKAIEYRHLGVSPAAKPLLARNAALGESMVYLGAYGFAVLPL